MRPMLLRRLALALCACACSLPAQRAAPSAGASWTKGGTCYEVFVRSFSDSDGDGVGDLNGLTQRLDYINDGNPRSTRSLGARCIWLMPIAESPSYHGYDVSNYYRVAPAYGTNDDFRRMVAAAHRRGIAVLVDMVLNHTSSENPWFLQAQRDTASPYRDWYRWSATPPAQKGPWGQDAWRHSPERDEWYWGVFWKTMPDLNYATPAVREEVKSIATYWLKEMGVDGFRLDAVPYLVEEGDSLIGSADTHAFLREYAAHVRRVSPRAFTVGEVWDGIDKLLPYYPGQLDSYFAFDLSQLLLAAMRTGDARALLDRCLRYQREVPRGGYSTFLGNHDQVRTLTALGGDVAGAKLAATLLLTLPGVSFVYYGEEIGMTGDKPDERLRTPMQWSAARNAGFTRGTPWEALQPDVATANVATQDRDPASLLNLYRRLIPLRAANAALAGGELLPLVASDPHVIAYLRRDGPHVALVVANLGRAPVEGVTFTSPDSALTAGTYAARSLLGGPGGATVRVGTDGRLAAYAPFPVIGPRESRVLGLSARPAAPFSKSRGSDGKEARP
ncbi:MAG: alpha-amylase family glycosyl hydrolase [Gemmatimonadaceae bacterium]